MFFPRNTGLVIDIFIKLEYIARSLVKIKSIPDWRLFISRMEMKWTKWYAMTSHVIAYRSLELLFGTHTFHFNCFLDDFNCVFTQIRSLSRVLLIEKCYQKLTFKKDFSTNHLIHQKVSYSTNCLSMTCCAWIAIINPLVKGAQQIIILLFLNQNIWCGYSKESSQ